MSNQTESRIRRVLVTGTSVAIAAMGLVPSVALAGTDGTIGWGPSDIARPTQDTSQFEAPGIAAFAKGIVQGCLGIAIAVFVLKIVLTAVDRLILAGGSSDESFRLDDIPLVGAYRDPERGMHGGQPGSSWTWVRIWSHFALQVGLCVSAWVITEVLIRLIGTVAGVSGV